MSKLRLWIAMSVDGFVAGPGQDAHHPLGVGGVQLHDWVFPLAAWRKLQGLPGGEVTKSTPEIEASTANIGSTIMGRNMFGGGPGPWSDNPWNGWWGEDPPSHHPVFVLTHHPRERLVFKGGTTFTSATQALDSAPVQARTAPAVMAAPAPGRPPGGTGVSGSSASSEIRQHPPRKRLEPCVHPGADRKRERAMGHHPKTL